MLLLFNIEMFFSFSHIGLTALHKYCARYVIIQMLKRISDYSISCQASADPLETKGVVIKLTTSQYYEPFNNYF